ncbi:hypothetical protein IWW36_002053 [Coemansia brasiliensis]|uniref:Uncharacterized protein n=1 Tax=Coemansia brasiliensis TaxID=2650707 RepID=A0A9W8LYH2_9FUNG|nr:hypothetical protein IWW36_002053 [Coemansia brasiliensis]
MSFEYTNTEKIRVFLASLAGVHLDHIGYADMATIIVWATVYGIQMLAIFYMLKNRRYRPIRSHQPYLMLLMYISSVFWFVGDITTNELIHLSSSPLTNCVFITVWLRSTLGQSLLVGTLVLRSITLYVKYKWNRKLSASMNLAVGGLLMASNIVPAIIITVMPTIKTIKYVPKLQVCDFNPQFKLSVVVLGWVTIGSALGSGIMLAVFIRCAHKEHRGIIAASSILAAASALQTAVFYLKPRYAASLAWRIGIVSTDQVAVLGAWWALMGRSLFNCMFRKQPYLIKWRTEAKIKH